MRVRPSVSLNKDTVYKADRLYIVGSDVVIPKGVTVTFEKGCEIQFYDDNDYYNSPRIILHGTLNLNGSKTNMVSVKPSEARQTFLCYIKLEEYSIFKADYVNFDNICFEYTETNNYSSVQGECTVSNSWLRYKTDNKNGVFNSFSSGKIGSELRIEIKPIIYYTAV